MKGSLISHLPDIIRVKLLGAGNVFISLDLHIGSGYQPSPGSLKGIGAFSFLHKRVFIPMCAYQDSISLFNRFVDEFFPLWQSHASCPSLG
ncbi:hypothetical protein BJD94_07245 [Vibrio vulnificus Env1]|nr:hypothetical protein BJD94_07245 [Vibrio vulnificus Env1]KHF82588.1 hypothetical protein OA19_19695 [Vibrio vulnificus]KHF83280.1 hypothetical protein OA16_20390 [Vibrio vulnificus]